MWIWDASSILSRKKTFHCWMETISKDMKDKKVIWGNLHWFIKQESCFTNLTGFYNDMTASVDKGRAVHTVYLAFSKAFATASCIILIDKLMKNEPSGQWGELKSSSTAAWCPAGGRWWTPWVNTETVSDLSDGTVCNLMEFNKGKCKVLIRGGKICRLQHRPKSNQLEIRFAEKALEVLVNIKQNISQQCIGKDVARGWRDLILPLYWWGHTCGAVSSCGIS